MVQCSVEPKELGMFKNGKFLQGGAGQITRLQQKYARLTVKKSISCIITVSYNMVLTFFFIFAVVS